MADRVVRYIFEGDETSAVRAMTRVEEGAGKAGKSLDLTGRKSDELGKHFSSLRGSLGSLVSGFGGLSGVGGLLAGGGVIAGLAAVTDKTKELATQTETFHAISGLGANESLRYSEALQARGIGAEAGGKAFRFLAKNIQLAERQEYTYGTAQQKAAEKGKLATGLLGVQALAFHRLGIQSAAAFKGLSSEQQFQTIIRAFSHMKDGTEKTQLALQIFGRGGTALLPVLNETSLGLEHQYQLAKRFFPTLKGEGVRSLEELKEKQAESKMAWEGLEFTLGMKLIPVLTAVMEWFTKVSQEIRQGTGFWGELGRTVEGVVNDFKAVVGWFERTPLALAGLKAALISLGGLWAANKIVAFGYALLGLVGPATAAEASLSPILTTLAGIVAAYELISHTMGQPHATPQQKREWATPQSRVLMGHAGPVGPAGPTVRLPAPIHVGEAGRSVQPTHSGATGHFGPMSHAEERKIVVHTHVHLDGHVVARNTSEHALKDDRTARNFGEAVTHHSLKRAARE
jgi:hypothetical protein